MTIDATPLGQVAAQVMDDINDDPDFGPDEVQHTDEDGDTCSTVSARATDNRNVLALGLVERAREALLNG